MLLNHYKELIEAAKSSDKEFTDSNTVDKSTKYFQTMRNRAFELADSMRKIASEDSKQKRRRILGWIVEGIIALALLLICSYFLGTVTGIFVLAALLTISHYLGWPERIKAFIEKIVWPE